MKVRLHCRACRTAFITQDDPTAGAVVCPKCGAENAPAPSLPASTVAGPGPETPTEPGEGSVFVPSGDEARPRRRRRAVLLSALGVLVLLAVAGAVAWPYLRPRKPPEPLDPVASAATAYLDALIKNDAEAAHRLGTVDVPPAIRSYRSVRHNPSRDATLKGSFAPLAGFHARVADAFDYDPSSGRYTPKNALGPAAETLDALHEAKANPELDGLLNKIVSGNADEQLDASVDYSNAIGKVFTKLADGALSPKKLVPTYKTLVEDAKPPLPPSEKALALDVADDRATWDALLNRPFTTLKADGPYVLERAEVTARTIDALGSSGDPPTPLRLVLTRFRLEGIDTGWKVTSARRVPKEPIPVPAPAPAPDAPPPSRYAPKPSP